MKTALIIAPHPDDETLGAGGTIKKLAEKGYDVMVVTVAAHMPPLYSEEVHQTTVGEAKAAQMALSVKDSVFLNKPAVSLNEIPTAEINRLINEQVQRVAPDIMLIPFYDRHIDHRVIFDACMVAARPIGAGRSIKLLAAYETISESHWNAPHIEPQFVPSLTVDITDQIDAKVEAMNCFKSQLNKFPGPRSIEALRALALFRGSQTGYGYAEAFQIIRMTAEAFLGTGL